MSAERIQAPPPGIYPGTPMGVYHRWDAASNSALSRLVRSAAHLRAYLDGEQEDTAALALGRAIHSAVLEPDDFASRYTVAEPCGVLLKSGARKGEPCGSAGLFRLRDLGCWACGTHVKGFGSAVESDVLALSFEDYRTCIGIRDSVAKSRAASGLISGPGEVELSMTWEDADTGVLCKARWDRHSPEIAGGAIVDVKSTRDASPRAFERSILDLGYHRQAAFYLTGARARKLPARHFSIIAVEKTPPYAVAVYRITEGVVDAAADQTRALLRQYAACRSTNHWPGYPDEVRDISVPDWAWRVMDEQTNEINERSAA